MDRRGESRRGERPSGRERRAAESQVVHAEVHECKRKKARERERDACKRERERERELRAHASATWHVCPLYRAHEQSQKARERVER